MRILDFLKKLWTRQPLDLRKAECPYCQKALDKIPKRRTKCPHCGEFMYVRTRPKDKVRVVVTKAEADKIDEEWERKYEYDSFISRGFSRKERFEKERERLRKQFGKEPSDRDVMWAILGKESGEHFLRRDFGFYSSTIFEKAEILRKEMRLEAALKKYFEVCYLDLNGPENLGGISDSGLKIPPFDPEKGLLAPAVVFEIKEIMKELEFDKNKAKLIFIEHNSKRFKSWQLPLTPENCWSSLEREIENPNGPYRRGLLAQKKEEKINMPPPGASRGDT